MSTSVSSRGRSLAALTLIGTLSACGGGGTSSTTTAEATAAASTPAAATSMAAAPVPVSNEAATTSEQRFTIQEASVKTRTTGISLFLRAKGQLAGGVGPIVQLRINGAVRGQVEVRSTTFQDYEFQLTEEIPKAAEVDLVYINDALVGGVDRNLFVSAVRSSSVWMAPTDPGVTIDVGEGAGTTDGVNVIPGQSGVYWNAALRFKWPATITVIDQRAKDAVRFLRQATFGPTVTDVDALMSRTPDQWITTQIATPYSSSYVDAVQAKYNLGAAYRPGGDAYRTSWIGNAMLKTSATASDQLRRRVAYALQQIFVVSQSSDDLYGHQRPYARYLDMLAEGAFGNYRQLLENVTLSPATAIYLSYLRNLKGDTTTGRKPDENFAREAMQLFSIGLVELNPDGTPKLGGTGQPIETYTNDDVEAMAKVMTGWSWGFDINNGDYFFNRGPDYASTGTARIDIRPMRDYPEFHANQAVTLFAGKAWQVNVPTGTPAVRLKAALDGLFNHPNVGPFMARQLIQRLVSSNPSPAYVQRVASVFNNNGSGVRGDLGAVVRAVLLDSEARSATPANTAGKLTEPVLRLTQWMRAFGVRSTSGEFIVNDEFTPLLQRPFSQPSVFNFYRPGYVAPNTSMATVGMVAPEFQIANESTVAQWSNLAVGLTQDGIGWYGSAPDVQSLLDDEAALITSGGMRGWLDRLDLMLFAGRMSDGLKSQIFDLMTDINPANINRVRLSLYLAMISAEFQIQK